jgi:MFS family permease
MGLCALQIGSIQIIAFIQGETPTALIGKVMSLVVMLPFLANALGQLLYGVLYEQFEKIPWLVIFATVVIAVAVSLYIRKYFRNVES